MMQRLLPSRASSRVVKAGATVAVEIAAAGIAVDVVAAAEEIVTTVGRVKIARLARIVDRSRMLMAMRSMRQSRLSR